MRAGDAGDLGRHRARSHAAQLIVLQRIPRSDQARRVRVEHAPVTGPQPHPLHRRAHHVLPHRPIEPLDGGRVAGKQPVAEIRLDRPGGHHPGQLPGVAHRLLGAGLAQHERHRQAAREKRGQGRYGKHGGGGGRAPGLPAPAARAGDGRCRGIRVPCPRRRHPGAGLRGPFRACPLGLEDRVRHWTRTLGSAPRGPRGQRTQTAGTRSRMRLHRSDARARLAASVPATVEDLPERARFRCDRARCRGHATEARCEPLPRAIIGVTQQPPRRAEAPTRSTRRQGPR